MIDAAAVLLQWLLCSCWASQRGVQWVRVMGRADMSPAQGCCAQHEVTAEATQVHAALLLCTAAARAVRCCCYTFC